MTAVVTFAMIRDAGACIEQLTLFTEIFPSGEVEVTEELCIRYASVFDWLWAIRLVADPLMRESAYYEMCKADTLQDEALIFFKYFTDRVVLSR